MNYETESLKKFILSRIGEHDFTRHWPVVDRLVSLYQEFKKLSSWLEENEDLLGQREYKEQVSALNGLMANILKLEDKLELFRVKDVGDGSNNMLAGMFDLGDKDEETAAE